DEMLAGAEKIGLLHLDLREVVGVHARAPEVRVFEILIGAVAQHVSDIGADEGRREVAAGAEAVDHGRGSAKQEREPRPGFLPRSLRLLAFGDVGPRTDDLGRLPGGIAQHLLAVVHPDIRAVSTADAIFDRTLVAFGYAIDPSVDARYIVGMDKIVPEIRIL